MAGSKFEPAFRLAAALACAAALSLQGTAVRAHGGHEGVSPTLKQIQVGSEQWQVGLGVVPPDPVAGEDLHLEVKADRLGAGGAEAKSVTPDDVRLRIDDTVVPLQGTEAKGVLAADYRLDVAGDHQVVVELRGATASRGTTDFPLTVRPGSVPRVRRMLVTFVAVLLVGIGVLLLRNASLRAMLASAEYRRPAIGAVVLLIAVVALVLGPVSAVVARGFLPQREDQSVDWVPDADAEAGPVLTADAAPDVAASPGSGSGDRSASADEAASIGEVLGRVVAAPHCQAEVVVPMTARVVPGSAKVTVGAMVSKGELVVTLQPTYIVHDAMHLINLRWPILVSTVDAKRLSLQTEATAERLKLALPDKAVSVREVQIAESAAAAARQEYEKWLRTLSIHDAQITDKQKPIEITSPINGEVATANFSQGQLVYESDPLFTIVDLSTVWVEARVPEEVVGRFNRDRVEFTAATFPGVTFTGALQRVAPAVDPVTRTLSHFYLVRNPRKLLRIGMLLNVQRGAPAAVS